MPEDSRARTASQPTFGRGEVAARAGVSDDFVERLCRLGILVEKDGLLAEADVRRTRILHGLDTAGMPMDALAEGMRRGIVELSFVEEPAYENFTGLADETFREAAERTRVPIEVLGALRESMGSPAPSADDRLRELELDALPALQLEVEYGIRPHMIERTLRVMGDSLRRMSEVEADWWMSDVIAPVLANGGKLTDVGPETA